MKKSAVLLFALFLSLPAYVQTQIDINFGITQNGSQLVLDSVLIENTTSACDTMIYNYQAGLVIDMISGISSETVKAGQLYAKQNYPNPFYGETNIEVYVPGEEISVKVFDTTGKMLVNESFKTGQGLQTFRFKAGSGSQYFVNFNCNGQEQSLKLTNQSDSESKTSIVYVGKMTEFSLKSAKSVNFVYNQGDVLNFTGYVTACHLPESTSFSDSPLVSQTYNFDFTYLTEIQPEAPVAGEITTTETSVNWNWMPVSGATGYKCNIENDYETATDLETYTDLAFNSVAAGTHYDLFVWAYNDCGESFPLHMDTCTQALPLTQDEIDLILGGASTTAMEVMDICEQPDSVILRTLSTNVIIGEENLQQLTDRMKVTVIAEGGVGIAAPQVGINRNIVWIQRQDKGTIINRPWELYFNPRIVAYSDTYSLRSDGCLSVSQSCLSANDIAGNSYRASWVDVEYYLADGTFVQERISQAYTAHIFQHEIDHLNAVMFFDRQEMPVPEK